MHGLGPALFSSQAMNDRRLNLVPPFDLFPYLPDNVREQLFLDFEQFGDWHPHTMRIVLRNVQAASAPLPTSLASLGVAPPLAALPSLASVPADDPHAHFLMEVSRCPDCEIPHDHSTGCTACAVSLVRTFAMCQGPPYRILRGSAKRIPGSRSSSERDRRSLA